MKYLLTDSTNHLSSSFTNHGSHPGRYERYFFADGERGYRLRENIQGEAAIVVASILPDPASLFDLLALNRLVRENGATETSLIIPYLGYARQDRPTREGEASIGMMVVELLRQLHASRLLVFDVHSDLIRRTLGPSLIELTAHKLFAAALAEQPPQVIVSPDAGSISRAEYLAGLLETRPEIAFIDKTRPKPNLAVARELHGEVRNRDVLLVDDIIDTGGTIAEAVKLLGKKGAASVRVAATHGIFSGQAWKRFSNLPIREVLITNTLPQRRHRKMRVLDIVPVILGVQAEIGSVT